MKLHPELSVPPLFILGSGMYAYDTLSLMLNSVASDLTSQFTGKERDAETGLDFFLARYYSPESMEESMDMHKAWTRMVFPFICIV
jgi:hypothetical protein